MHDKMAHVHITNLKVNWPTFFSTCLWKLPQRTTWIHRPAERCCLHALIPNLGISWRYWQLHAWATLPMWKCSEELFNITIVKNWLQKQSTLSLQWDISYRGADKSLPNPTERTIERLPFFIRCGVHCCCGDLVVRTTFWTGFDWLAKVRVWSL